VDFCALRRFASSLASLTVVEGVPSGALASIFSALMVIGWVSLGAIISDGYPRDPSLKLAPERYPQPHFPPEPADFRAPEGLFLSRARGSLPSSDIHARLSDEWRLDPRNTLRPNNLRLVQAHHPSVLSLDASWSV
jgi:hypothetical protein